MGIDCRTLRDAPCDALKAMLMFGVEERKVISAAAGILALRSLKEQVSQEVTLFFYDHKRMDTSHLESVWPANR